MAIELNLPSTITGAPEGPLGGLRDFVGEAQETVNSVNEALGVLNEGMAQGGAYQFPGNLGSRRIEFLVKPRDRKAVTDKTQTGPTTIIALPIPTNLQTGYNAQYSETGIGVFGNELRTAMEEGSSVVDFLQQRGIDTLQQSALAIAASASREVAAVLGAASVEKLGLGAAGIGAGVGGAAGGAVQGALAAKGIAVNPHLAVLFEGVNFRTHSFQYKFSARTESESYSLNNIIYEFKKAMHPSIDGKAFFKYPDEFDIRFPNDQGFLFEIGKSVLRDFSLNYTPDGGSYFHKNGAPVSVQMSMTFVEIDILTKQEIGNAPGGK